MLRREFLARGVALTGGLVAPRALRAQSLASGADGRLESPRQVRVWMTAADGKPFAKASAATLSARDLANDPLPQRMVHAVGRARVELSREPIQFSLLLNVPGFGEVYCWADNDGRGYTSPGNISFVQAAAATRLRRVREAAALAGREGVSLDRRTREHLAAAARPVEDDRTAYAALSAGLHAGEQIALARARHRIARFAEPRKDFLFGCLIAPFASLGAPFEQAVRKLFNFATASWYTWEPEQPVGTRIDYARMDASIDWCIERNILPKGFGYCYMTRGATPEWLRAWPFKKLLPEYRRVVRQTMQRYAPRLKYAEIINEAHDKANLWDLTQSQVIDITRAVCEAAREGSASVKRVINHCCLWAEYAGRANPDGSRRWSPYRYLEDCVAGGVEFEVVGLQLYHPKVDVLEIERMLERFAKFQRPIHITEIATASAAGADANSMRPRSIPPGWHGPWSEEAQADWLEAIYTLVYSKPQFDAITWWDLTDVPGHFWPHGGLLRADLTPKPAYQRLVELQKAWGVARG